MNTRSALLPLLCVLSTSAPAAVAQIRYRAQVDYTTKTAEYLSIDRDGSLLVSTDTGIVRWDGTRMEHLLQGKAVHATHRDRKGNLWTGLDLGPSTFDRLARIDPAGNIVPLTVMTWVNDIAEDDSGVVWVATQEGLYAFQDTTLIYHPTFKPDSLDKYLTSLAFDDAGNLWVGGSSGIARISPARQVTYFGAANMFANSSIRKAPDGAMWASTTGGLLRWDGSSWVEMAPGKTSSIAFGSDGRLYYRADSSVLVWNGSALDTFSKAPVKVPNRESPLIADAHGHLWTGSGTGALLELDVSNGRSTRRPLYEEGFPGRSIFAMHHDSLGRLWVGTNLGLSRLSEQGRRTFPVVALYGMVEPRAGEIWGTDYHNQSDIFRFADDSISHLTPSTNINKVAASPNGEIAAYTTDLLYRYKGNTTPIAEQVDSISAIQAIGFCPDGKLVVGGYYSGNRNGWAGFWQPGAPKWTRELPTGVTPNSLWCAGQGDVWFQTNTSNVFLHRHGDSIRQVVRSNGDRGYSILPSPAGHPYLVIPTGVFRPDADDHLVPVSGWDSASVRAMGITMGQLASSYPAPGEALWIAKEAQALFLDDAPWRGEVGVKPRTASTRSTHLDLSRRISGWAVGWSGAQGADLLATDLAGRTVWSGKVAAGGSVSLDRPERFLVLRVISAGSPAEVRKLAAP